MIEWNTKLKTSEGDVSIKDIATKYSGNDSGDFRYSQFTAQTKTDRRIVASPTHSWIYPESDIFVMNEMEDWVRLKGLYFHKPHQIGFETWYSRKNPKKNRFSITTDPSQKFLCMGSSKLVWKSCNDLLKEGLGVDKGVNYFKSLKEETICYEYFGTLKKFDPRMKFFSVHADISYGVCTSEGIVLGSNTC